MFLSLAQHKRILLVVLAVSVILVATTHSMAMELMMGPMQDCTVQVKCCDCTVPETAESPAVSTALPLVETVILPSHKTPASLGIPFDHPPQ
jgi:hypothetical protein